jgi:DNA primase
LDDEIKREIRERNDIVDVISQYTQLKQLSGRYVGLCPFHNEKTPSFSVNGDKQFFHCFGCGVGGDVFSFVMRVENMDFPEVIKFLANRVNYQMPEKNMSVSAKKLATLRESIAQLNKRAAVFFHDHLHSNSDDAVKAREYLEQRGVKLVRKFGLGLSPPSWDGLMKHLSDISPSELLEAGLVSQSTKDKTRFYDRFRKRLMFPIIAPNNRVVGFGGRALEAEDNPKYINSPETSLFKKSELLYGMNLAKKSRNKEIIITEGYMDVLALYQAGFNNVVGVLGTALTESHLRLLRSASCESVVLFLDSDTAGTKAILRAIPILVDGGIKVRVLQTGADAKDPDEYIKLFGVKKLSQLIENAKSHITFQVKLLHQQHDMTSTDGRVAFTQDSAKILAKLESPAEADAYATEISELSGIAKSAIRAEIAKIQGTEQPPPKVIKPKVTVLANERGLNSAQKGLLYLVLTTPSLARALHKSKYLEPEQMGNETYSQLLQIAFDNADNENNENNKNNVEITPVDIIAQFDTPQAQSAVTEIFATQLASSSLLSFGNNNDALNDMATKIKRAWLDNQININVGNQNALKEFVEYKKNLTSLNITMWDG